MVVFKKNIVGIRSYKNRFHSFGKTFKFKFDSQFAIITTNEAVMELVQLGFIKKLIKQFAKKKRKINRTGKYRRKKKVFRLKKNIRIEGIIGRMGKGKRRSKWRRIWINMWPNHILTRKSKNSRMGKGKGVFNRWCLKVKRGVTIIECVGLPKFILANFVTFFNKKAKLKLSVVENIKKFIRLRSWSSGNFSYTYLHKHRAQ